MNWIKKAYRKILAKDDGLARLSTTVSQINIPPANDPRAVDTYSANLFLQKASLIEQSLRSARQQTKIMEAQIHSIANQPSADVHQAIKEIISAAEAVSLNGLKILKGEEVLLNYQKQAFSVKLPNHAEQAFGLKENPEVTSEVQQKFTELDHAIDESLQELQKFLAIIETGQQNYLSAGIDLALLLNQSQ